MNKTIRILSVIVLILACLGLFLLAVCVGAQKVLQPLFYGHMDAGEFVIPVAQIIYGLGVFAVAVLLVVGRENPGIGLQIVSVILIAVLPQVQTLLSTVQTQAMGRVMGSSALASISIVNAMCNTVLSVSRTAALLALVVCGMLFALKKTQKQNL